jgi:hypothetical protein
VTPSILRRLLRGHSHPSAPAGRTEAVWSIGIYVGVSPLELQSPPQLTNPVLTRANVTDVRALFVADPFMIRVDDKWHMFFEVYNKANRKGEIGYASSANGITWEYKQIVLSELFHLSYPCIFEWKDDFYMIPESRAAGEVRLYRAAQFPLQWEYVTTLLSAPYADSTIFRFEDRWWLFTDASDGFRMRHRESELGFRHDTSRLFHADDLTGVWHEHPKSPIVSRDPHIARPGGRVFAGNNSLIRFGQDCYPSYGKRLFGLRITQLSPTCYEECEIGDRPVLTASGSGWNRDGMHHVDVHPSGDGLLIACVDGHQFALEH